jgi:phosphoglycerol transferase MdoB-like AlkP superfamily enzyme
MRAHLSAWLVRHLPEALAAAPERVLLNLSFILIGLSVFAGSRSRALDWLYPTPLYEWACIMIIGGVATLVGMFSRKRSVERLGVFLLLVGCAVYGVLILAALGESGIFSGSIFLALSVAKAIRMFVSSAARSTAIHWGEQMKENSQHDGET